MHHAASLLEFTSTAMLGTMELEDVIDAPSKGLDRVFVRPKHGTVRHDHSSRSDALDRVCVCTKHGRLYMIIHRAVQSIERVCGRSKNVDKTETMDFPSKKTL